MVQSLISQSPDIQKILAFEGALEKLFNTIEQEGGVEGGIVAHDALICVDGLLRFNTSNQVGYCSTSYDLLSSSRMLLELFPRDISSAGSMPITYVCAQPATA
jgi:hypothetical protein